MTKNEKIVQRYAVLLDSMQTLVEEKEKIEESLNEKTLEINQLVLEWLTANGVRLGDKVRYTYALGNEKTKKGEGVLDFDDFNTRVKIDGKSFDEFTIFRGYLKIKKVEE